VACPCTILSLPLHEGGTIFWCTLEKLCTETYFRCSSGDYLGGSGPSPPHAHVVMLFVCVCVLLFVCVCASVRLETHVFISASCLYLHHVHECNTDCAMDTMRLTRIQRQHHMHTYQRTHAHTTPKKQKTRIYQQTHTHIHTRIHTHTHTHTFRSYCGSNAANWNTKKNVMDALKASVLWGGSALSPSTSLNLPQPPSPSSHSLFSLNVSSILLDTYRLSLARSCTCACALSLALRVILSHNCTQSVPLAAVQVRVCIDIYRCISVCSCMYM